MVVIIEETPHEGQGHDDEVPASNEFYGYDSKDLSWAQNSTEVSLLIPIPARNKAPSCFLTKTTLEMMFEGQLSVIKGSFSSLLDEVSAICWVVNNQFLIICLPKHHKGLWSSLTEDGPKVKSLEGGSNMQNPETMDPIFGFWEKEMGVKMCNKVREFAQNKEFRVGFPRNGIEEYDCLNFLLLKTKDRVCNWSKLHESIQWRILLRMSAKYLSIYGKRNCGWVVPLVEHFLASKRPMPGYVIYKLKPTGRYEKENYVMFDLDEMCVKKFSWGNDQSPSLNIKHASGAYILLADHEHLYIRNIVMDRLEDTVLLSGLGKGNIYSICNNPPKSSYMVVRLSGTYRQRRLYHLGMFGLYNLGEFTVHVFSGRTRVWTRVASFEVDNPESYNFEEGVFHDGTLYWLSLKRRRGYQFDATNCTVASMKLPEEEAKFMFFGKCGEMLYLIGCKDDIFTIYHMSNKEWLKQYTVMKDELEYSEIDHRILCLFKPAGVTFDDPRPHLCLIFCRYDVKKDPSKPRRKEIESDVFSYDLQTKRLSKTNTCDFNLDYLRSYIVQEVFYFGDERVLSEHAA